MSVKSLSATVQLKRNTSKPDKSQELAAILAKLPDRLRTLHLALGAGEWRYRCPPYVFILNFSNMLRWLADHLETIAESKK